MSEFDCFLTVTEFGDLLSGALGDGYRIQANKNMAKPDAEYCPTTESVRTALVAGQHSFLLERSDFTRYPVKLRPILRDGETYWYPRAKEGGPTIEACFFAPFVKDGRRFIACSLVSYHAKIINPETGELEAAGDAIKAAYSVLIAGVRKQGRKVKSTKRIAIVSPAVDAMLDAGWSLASPFS